MSKKTLPILLLLPFIFSLLFFVASNFLITKIDGDITDIIWAYRNHEGFALKDKEVELIASAVAYEDEIDTTLIWSIKNLDDKETPHAYIEKKDNKNYLILNDVGDIEVKVTNISGNVSKSFTATIYEDGVILLNTKRARSYSKIDSLDYYGEYDFVGESTKSASFELNIETLPSEIENYLYYETSSNIRYDNSTGIVDILSPGDAYIKFYSTYMQSIKEQIYNFKVIKDGYNVYDYNELLKCTSLSEEGKIVCLQTNLESSINAFLIDEKGNKTYKDEVTKLFGNIDESSKKIDFSNDVYRFESTYNTEYIDQFNLVHKNEKDKLSKEVVSGVRIQKDFYGNGYVINAHDLTFPTVENPSKPELLTPSSDALFKGPLPFVIIGNKEKPIVKAYGQDNIGFYVDGNNILLNDVHFKNCEFSSILQNNDYTGTVLEVNGDNVTVSNSIITSGRTVLRAFSCENLIVKNTLLEKGREFIAKIGSNEYLKMNMDGEVSFTYNNEDYKIPKEDFFKSINDENSMLLSLSFDILAKGLLNNITKEQMISYANTIQKVLTDVDIDSLKYKSSVTFIDTYFYQSGIFSLGLDSMFNGPYLFDGSPASIIIDEMVGGVVAPNNIGGVSYPSSIKLVGDTRFYDYKQESAIDASCLVYQDLAGLTGETVDLDSFFPVKSLFKKEMEKRNYQHIDKDKVYYNTPIVKYGGGLNLSTVNIDELDSKEHLTSSFELDTFLEAMSLKADTSNYTQLFAMMMGRCVPMATGFAPFEVMVYKGNLENEAYLYGKQVTLDGLKARA